MTHDLHMQPPLGHNGSAWRDLAAKQPDSHLLGHAQSTWRDKTRHELGLATDRPIIATGHQTMLWHPGILAKFLVVDQVARAQHLATANLIVDQHVGHYGRFDVPVHHRDGTLAVRAVDLTPPSGEPMRSLVPMGLQSAFDPPASPKHLSFALDSVRNGVERIFDRTREHADAPNAALQMAGALADLMQDWVSPMPNVTACDLVDTSLSRAMLQRMLDDPRAMAEAYNDAVASVPEAGIPPLLMHDLYVEVPLWRIRADGQRMRAYDNDIERWLEGDVDVDRLLPRALFMTALVRLGMCDLFIHGTGGARYDRAMERWIRNWLGVDVAPIAVTTATVTLPLMDHAPNDLDAARASVRKAWHDPEALTNETSLGECKRELLHEIERLPRNSPERKAAFFHMHHELSQLREQHRDAIEQARQAFERARHESDAAMIAQRRDWAFPLYDRESIDELVATVCDAQQSPGSACPGR